MISHEELTSVLDYDPDTGLFRWNVKKAYGSAVGDIAGSRPSAANQYIAIKIDGRLYGAHRLAWFYTYKEWPKEIDHINHCPSDNRLKNLRAADRKENCRNRSLWKTNNTGLHGVRKYDELRWHSYARIDGKLIRLGIFDDFFEACCARKSVEAKYGVYHKNHGIAPEQVANNLPPKKLRGISFGKDRGLWQVYIDTCGKRRNIGRFADFFEACCARKSAEAQLAR